MNTTLLLRGEFDVLAVNLFAFEDQWQFLFARNSDLPTSTYRKYTEVQRQQLLASLVTVTLPAEPPFYTDLCQLLDEMIAEGSGHDPDELGLS